MDTPTVRTHSVRQTGHPVWRFSCRGCGDQWPTGTDVEWLERQPCGTRAPDPGSEAPR